MKPGWFSSEAHLAAATTIITSLVFLGYVSVGDKDSLTASLEQFITHASAAAVQIAALVSYFRSRTKLKLQQMELELDPVPAPIRRFRIKPAPDQPDPAA